MPDSDNRMISSAAPACRKTYLSKIVIGYPKRQNFKRGVRSPVRAPCELAFHASVAEIRPCASDLAARGRACGVNVMSENGWSTGGSPWRSKSRAFDLACLKL